MGASDRLSGWKEIAGHLRRSVRSVQRWEHELALPVQRVKTRHGQVVFANRADLDAWMARQSVLPVDELELPDAEIGKGTAAVDLSVLPVVPVPTVAQPSGFRWRWAVLLVIVAGLVGAGLARLAPRPVMYPVDSVVLMTRTLEGRASTGELLWAHGKRCGCRPGFGRVQWPWAETGVGIVQPPHLVAKYGD